MPSARRQRLLVRKQKGKRVSIPIFKFLIPFFVILIAWFFVFFNTRYWNGTDKLAYVTKEDGGNVIVTVLDPKLSESITLIIPGDTQVAVSGNYGTLKIKNVWQLGVNEKLGGKLLSQTVTKNFLAPNFLWSDNDILATQSFNILGIIKFVFVPKSTNVPMGDRFAIALFSMRVKNVNNTTIDLGKSQFLKKTILNDGTKGYILTGPVSPRLTVNFSDNDFADKNLRVDIVDATGIPGSANSVGQIIEVLGGKVVSIDRKSDATNTDCSVSGTNQKIVKKIATLFGCKTSVDKTVFDLEIRLGAQFANRY